MLDSAELMVEVCWSDNTKSLVQISDKLGIYLERKIREFPSNFSFLIFYQTLFFFSSISYKGCIAGLPKLMRSTNVEG